MTREEILKSSEYWEEQLQNSLAERVYQLGQQTSEEQIKKELDLSDVELTKLKRGEARTITSFVKVLMKTDADKFTDFLKSLR